MLEALIVEDDPAALGALAELVRMEGFSTLTAANLKEARRAIARRVPDLVLCDLLLPDGHGTELLEDLEGASAEVILVTGNATVETAVQALRLGAYDYLVKPVDVPRLKMLVAQVRRTWELKSEVSSLRDELRKLGRFGALVGTSEPMQRVYDLIEKVAPTSASVFLIGESGTGKELVANAIHRLSRRHQSRYLPLNCGAVAPTLMESELFGHERGSFTGATRQHKGYFERADGGTLFLDEITEMPVELQVKLLRVLETGTVLRVGGDQPLDVDVRVITATNRDPEAAVQEGKLREDLLYRLNVFPIHLPPLRERDGDIELLANEFLAELNRREEADKRFGDDAVRLLAAHHWPGNVRALKNVVQRAHILAEDVLDADCLPPEVSGEVQPLGPYLQVRVGSSVAEVERRLILATLHRYEGDKKAAAAALGISLKTLYNRLNDYQARSE